MSRRRFGSLLVCLLAACSSTDPARDGAAGAESSVAGSNAGAGAPSGGDTEPAAQQGMTAAHNAARFAVMPAPSTAIPPLVWSQTVASAAQAWAERCQFEHSGGKYGENIYASSGQSTPTTVVTSWASEAADYDYAKNSCSGVCGHYTQVVWRKSERLGCGFAQCTKNSPFGGSGGWQLWVCNYDPPGNFNGQKPY